MNETTFNWNDLRLFMAVAREGGLHRASHLTGSSPATLSRRMLELERELGQELFIRHDRGYTLTDKGQDLLQRLYAVEADIFSATCAQKPPTQPMVKISAGTWTSAFLMDHFDKISGNPMDVSLRFIAAEPRLDVRHREIMIGIRNQKPSEPSLVIRKLSRVEFAPYATKTNPDGWIKVTIDTPSARWVSQKSDTNIVCEVNHPRNALDLALNGYGCALLPTFIGDQQKSLQRIDQPVAELAHNRYLVTHQDDRHLPYVRRVINRLVNIL